MAHNVCYWACDICHQQYLNQDDAFMCEQTHFIPKEVKVHTNNWVTKEEDDIFGRYYTRFPSKFPDQVDVSLVNGSNVVHAVYKLTRIPYLMQYPMPILGETDATS